MVALLGDTHFGKNGFNIDFFENQMKFYQNQFFPYLLENNINHVICTGDFFDHGTRQDVRLLLRVKNEFLNFFEKNKIMLTVLVGNHDIYYKNTREITTLDMFDNYEYLRVIKEPTIMEIGNITWELYPWLLNGESFAPKSKYIIGHFEINGFRMVGNFECTFGMKPNSLKGMKQVISGHFHLKQEKDAIKYIGTPYAMDWNDVNEDKGFYILDDNANLEFIRNEESYNYYEFTTKMIDEELCYFVGNRQISLEIIKDLSDNGNKVRINSSIPIPLEVGTNNIIIDIVETKKIEDKTYANVNDFVKDSLSDKAYNEFTSLYELLNHEDKIEVLN